ncbi:MAG: SIMPL domain-containing protein [Candidatus Paceibacterota bacterium]|jgi:hypothetical protein
MNEQSKNSLFGALTLFVLVLTVIFVYSIFWGPLHRYSQSLISPRTMAVSASDKVTVKPDIANLSFSVITEGMDTAKVVDENNKKINLAIDIIKQEGVSEEDIRTSEYNLSPVYTYPTRSSSGEFVPKIAKYTLTQSVSLKIRDFTKISVVLQKLPALGINKIENIYFSIDDPDIFLSSAREGAFKKAFEKADKMARQNGVSLGRVVSISDYSNNYYPTYEKYGMGGDMMSSSASPISAPDIQPGSKELTVNVSVVYEIK